MSTSISLIEQLLPEPVRPHYRYIAQEVQPLIDDGSYAQAIERVEMILRTIPSDQDNRLLRAALLAKRGQIRLEDECYEEAEEDLRHAIHNGMRVAPVWALSGWAHYHLDQLDKAQEFFDRALEALPEDESARTGRAMVLIELEEYEKARSELTQTLTYATKRAPLYSLRAEANAQLHDLAQAERDIKAARDADPRDTDHVIAHARLLALNGKPLLALEALEQALARDEEPSLELLLLRSHLRRVNGQLDKALADANQALKLEPEDDFERSLTELQLALVLLARGDAGGALQRAQRVLEIDEVQPDALRVSATALRQLGDLDAARQAMAPTETELPELPSLLFEPFASTATWSDVYGELLDSPESLSPQQPEAVAAASAGGGGPFGALGGLGGLGGLLGGGMDPMRMMSQMFDEEGNIKPAFKPLLQMALKNAPALLKNMPAGMVKNLGGVDKETLSQVDLSNVSAEDLEAQMKQVYKMMKSGDNPQDMMQRAREELERNKK